MKSNLAYRQALESKRKRLIAERDEAERILNASPQLLEARHNSPYPDVYFHFKRKARSAWIGALAMWAICITLGGGFTILAYELSWLAPWLSGLIVFLVWAAVTLMIGVGTDKTVQFGLNISPSSPFSVGKAVKGILVCGVIFIVSFTGLLLLRTLISLPMLIALQAIFEISTICASSFFKAIHDFYIELPDLRDHITRLDAAIDRVDGELAMLDSEDTETSTHTVSSSQPPRAKHQAQHVDVAVNVLPNIANDGQPTQANSHVKSTT